MEHAHLQAVWFVDKLPRLMPFMDDLHLAPVPLIFTSLSIHSVILELVKVFLHDVLRGSAHLLVHPDVRLHPRR